MITQQQRIERLSPVASSMTVRAYHRPSDYKIAQTWWMKHNQKYLSADILSPIGLVVEQAGQPVAMGWLYLSNAALTQFGWIVTKPDLGPKARVVACTMLLDQAEITARRAGYKALQMFSDHTMLNRLAEAAGFEAITQHEFLFKVLDDDDDI